MNPDRQWWRRMLTRRGRFGNGSTSRSDRLGRGAARERAAAGWPSKPQSQRPDIGDAEWAFVAGTMTERTLAIRLHRFLRDNIPLLKAVVWTWTRLAAAPHRFEVIGDVGKDQAARAQEVLAALDRRIYPDRVVRFGGFDGLLVQYFDSLFTDGAISGELTLLPSRRGLDRFEFIDTATLEFESGSDGRWRMYQRQESDRIALHSDAIFYQPLDADAGRPFGKSLLAAVGFVARIEQELVRDMQKAMHNAGYQRLHVKVKPPTQGAAESDSDYTARANTYFDGTVRELKSFAVDDNPVTWDDVEIAHIGPGSQVSASRNWYLNHRAMVEDVIAGCHLAPFMLGYSYGTTETWARFKFEMIGRQILSLQRAASRFCEWIAAIELALAGIDVTVRHVFDNRLEFDRRERFEADRAQTDLVLRQLDAGLLTVAQAQQRLGIAPHSQEL